MGSKFGKWVDMGSFDFNPFTFFPFSLFPSFKLNLDKEQIKTYN